MAVKETAAMAMVTATATATETAKVKAIGGDDGNSAIACDCVPSRLEGHFRAYEHHPETRRSKS